MDVHQTLLIDLIKEERIAARADADFYAAKQISVRSGVNESTLSRFLNGKQDLKAGDFFAVINSFSEEFQERFWARFHRSTKGDWRSLILSADSHDIEEILRLLAEWWQQKQNTSKSTDKKSVALSL
jgi:hypothetical protein